MKKRKAKTKRQAESNVIMYYVAFRFDDASVVDRKMLRDEIIQALKTAALNEKLGSAEFLVGYDPR